MNERTYSVRRAAASGCSQRLRISRWLAGLCVSIDTPTSDERTSYRRRTPRQPGRGGDCFRNSYFLRGLLIALALTSCGANYRTANFLVTADDEKHAELLGEKAEMLRYDLAREWLGEPLPSWGEPCPIRIRITNELGGRGETSYIFSNGRPISWRMSVRGSLNTILHSVLPHEIAHTIFATYFGQPMPRWAEEGACVIVEDLREREKLETMLPRHIKLGRTYALRVMFRLEHYPDDVLPFYIQGYSVVNFLEAEFDQFTIQPAGATS